MKGFTVPSMRPILVLLFFALSNLTAGIIFAASPPNVILVMCDDLGWGDPRCYNPESRVATPNIDAMAEAGMRFTRFYAAAPVCSPTRGSCLTGRHPSRLGIPFANNGHLRESEDTLAEWLKKSGYRTGHFGKWHLGTMTKTVKDSNRGGPKGKEHFSPPQQHGFDVCFSTEAKVPTYDPLIRPKENTQSGWDYLKDKSQAVAYGTRFWNEKGEEVSKNLQGDASRIVMDRAIPFIESSATSKQPFLAVIWFHAPHLPVVAGPEHVAPYQQYDKRARNYYGCIAALDEQVGRLRASLRLAGIANNTILWFCSDNGPEGNEKAPGSAGHLRGRKRSLYEGGVRVPGILEWPGQVQAGATCDFPVVTSDLLPTILDVVKIPLDPQRKLDGISVLPAIAGKATVRETPIGFQSRNQQSWVTQRYKLYTDDAGKTWQLFDLLDDPSEQKDLSNKEPAKVQELQSQLSKWLADCAESSSN